MADIPSGAAAVGGSFLTTAAPIIGAGLTAVADVASGLFSANQARKNRKFQERMYNKQVEDNRKNWEMVNAYNLPSAQLARLRDSGLNPLLMYSNGAQGLTVSQPAQGGTPGSGAMASMSNHTNFGQAFAQAVMMKEQLRNLQMDSLLKFNEAKAQEAEAKKKGVETQSLSFDLSFKKDARDLQMDALKYQNELTESMRFLNDQQRYKLVHEISTIDAQYKEILGRIKNQRDITEAEVNEINNRIDIANKKLGHEISLLDAQAREALANAYANEIAAAIQKKLFSDDYIKILHGQAGQDLLNAIKDGEAATIANGLNALTFMYRPKPGEAVWNVSREMEYIINPIFGTVKDAAVGGAMIYMGAKGVGGKTPKIGFVK